MAGFPDSVGTLDRLGLLGSEVNYAHANQLTEREFALIAESGGSIAISPSIDMLMALGTYPATGRALGHGIPAGLSVDTTTSAGTDLFRDPRDSHVKIGLRFCRIAYLMVAGQQVFRIPALRTAVTSSTSSMLSTVNTRPPWDKPCRICSRPSPRFPRPAHADEAKPLLDEWQRIQAGRRRGPQLLGDILPLVLARLGVGVVQSTTSGEQDPK